MPKVTPKDLTPATDGPAGQAEFHDLRCDCGKLLARVLHSVLELKCHRCKRVVLIVGGRPFAAMDSGCCTCTPEPGPPT